MQVQLAQGLILDLAKSSKNQKELEKAVDLINQNNATNIFNATKNVKLKQII